MTPKPLWKSAYSLPSTSQTRLPWPWSMNTCCGGVSWNDEGTPRGIVSVACRHNSCDRLRLAMNSASSRAVSSATRRASMRATSVDMFCPHRGRRLGDADRLDSGFEGALEDVQARGQLVVTDGQRHQQTDDIVVQAGPEQCQAAPMSLAQHRQREGGRGLAARPVVDQLERCHGADPAHVA